ncbi:hypothetical protein [Tumebacillus lipolyticus]|uniref:Uncharacterized protein n=1 Tax=Tumebacillus lipolyticus TaxID=1280370 RepID=A0ABW4ZTZ0_9BACL
MERNQAIAKQLSELKEKHKALIDEFGRQEKTEEVKANIIPLVRYILDVYDSTEEEPAS